MLARTTVVGFSLLALGCGRGGSLAIAASGDLRASPMALELPGTFAGVPTSATVEVTNVGGSPVSVPVSIDAPFTAGPGFELARGESRRVQASLDPPHSGHFVAALRLGAVTVPVSGEVMPVPDCSDAGPCAALAFDPGAGGCVARVLPDGAACESGCVASGSCQAGQCLGQFRACDDGDACTAESCGEASGCVHTPVSCPPPNDPCHEAMCDRASGCGSRPVADGTLCGPDDCTAVQVNVCLAGQCQVRPRPASGLCVNTWVPLSTPARMAAMMAYDSARQRMIVFGGTDVFGTAAMADTWERPGLDWSLRTPANSPPARSFGAVVEDSVRQRLVLFGGLKPMFGPVTLADTWEWDGTTWLDRTPSSGPSGRFGMVMAYDSARRRVVLFGGDDASATNSRRNDTWAWDGARWLQLTPMHSPPAILDAAMAFDVARGKAVMFGGMGPDGQPSAATWEFDGSDWTQVSTPMSPPAQWQVAMAWDPSRQRVALSCEAPEHQLWEFDGAQWTLRPSSNEPGGLQLAAFAFDVSRQRLVRFAGTPPSGPETADTWEFDGQQWVQPAPVAQPSGRFGFALATETARNRVLLFGGEDKTGGQLLGDTWEFDGLEWLLLSPAVSPTARMRSAVAYDEARRVTVLFGGTSPSATLNDTWEWDGAQWLERTPATSPPALSQAAAAYDPQRQVTVLYGGLVSLPDGGWTATDATWEWNGTDWTERTGVGFLTSYGHNLVYDARRARVLAFGGRVAGYASSTLSEWDGTAWVLLMPQQVQPPERVDAQFGYDPSRGLDVLFSGTCLPGEDCADTWQFVSGTWVQLSPHRSPNPIASGGLTYEPVRKKMMLEGDGQTWFFSP